MIKYFLIGVGMVAAIALLISVISMAKSLKESSESLKTISEAFVNAQATIKNDNE